MLDEKAAGRAGAGGTLREVILGGALFGVLEAVRVRVRVRVRVILGGALFGVLEAVPALPLALAHSP